LQLKVYEGLEASMSREFVSQKSSRGLKLQFTNGRCKCSTEFRRNVANFLTEEIMCAQNFNFAFHFFSRWRSTSPNFAFFGQTFSDKIFWQFFDNWKFTVGNCPPTICLLATTSLTANRIKSNWIKILSNQIGVVVSWIAHLNYILAQCIVKSEVPYLL